MQKLKDVSKKLQTLLDSCALHRSRADEGECGCDEFWKGNDGECTHTRALETYDGLYTDYGHGSCIRVNEFALAQRLAAIDEHRRAAMHQSLVEWVAGEYIELPHVHTRERIRAAIAQVQQLERAKHLEIAG